jgi:23S rRNA (pseudouridine1915-N3)-methyltransferase
LKIRLVVVGRARGAVAAAIDEYEKRIRRYFTFEIVEVREEPARSGRTPRDVRAEEGSRILARVAAGTRLVALHETGESWSSEALAKYLASLALHGAPGVSFCIGGAFGLDDALLSRATRQLSLSAFTLPHEIARLVLVEQIYRAGTINRNEPYHKTR